jgi:hypothetical protein
LRTSDHRAAGKCGLLADDDEIIGFAVGLDEFIPWTVVDVRHLFGKFAVLCRVPAFVEVILVVDRPFCRSHEGEDQDPPTVKPISLLVFHVGGGKAAVPVLVGPQGRADLPQVGGAFPPVDIGL